VVGRRSSGTAGSADRAGRGRLREDAADDWIADAPGKGDIVVTADIPLRQPLRQGRAEVIAPNGKPFTETIDRDDAGGFVI